MLCILQERADGSENHKAEPRFRRRSSCMHPTISTSTPPPDDDASDSGTDTRAKSVFGGHGTHYCPTEKREPMRPQQTTLYPIEGYPSEPKGQTTVST